MRVARWLELNMEEVVKSRPAVFSALAVVDRLVTGTQAGEDWHVVLDRLATALLVQDTISGQARLVTAALDPVGHLLAREMVTRANLLVESKSSLLAILAENIEILQSNKTGANVLRGLKGVI